MAIRMDPMGIIIKPERDSVGFRRFSALGLCALSVWLCSGSLALAVTKAVVFTDEDRTRTKVGVSAQPALLKSDLRQRYSAYQVTLKNDNPQTVHLAAGLIDNAVSETTAYQSTNSARALTFWHKSCGWPIIGVFSAFAYAGLRRHQQIAHMEAIHYQGETKPLVLKAGESKTLDVLVRKGEVPHVQLNLTAPAKAPD